MKYPQKKVPLHDLMLLLEVSDTGLAAQSGVDRTLISRWRRGERAISPRSTQLLPVARALLALDRESLLDAYLAPWRQQGETNEQALSNHLAGEAVPVLSVQARQSAMAVDCEYTKQVQVYLGHKGFRKATLTMLEYVQQLPLEREVRVLCQGRYDWLVGDLAFVAQFAAKLRKSLRRGTRLLVINRRGYSIAETAAFAGPWLLLHLHGYIHSLYYDGEMPRDIRFLASIPGYWSGRAEERDGVENSLYVQTQADLFDIRRDERIIEEYLAMSRPASQYGFLKNPLGAEENIRLWRDGPLPAWTDAQEGSAPGGSFYALCRVPGFGIMTANEFDAVRGKTPMPPVPEYMFSPDGLFAHGPHRVMLCREDVKEGLRGLRRMHEPISALLGRRAFVTREILAAQLHRLLEAMTTRNNFEVALLPRAAFEKLRLELVCWSDSVSIGWLQSAENSVFADDKATSGSFHGFLGFVWGKMLAGWKRQDKVARQLRKWLAGKDLRESEPDSATVRNWDAMP